MRLIDNPVFRRDIALSGRPFARLARLPALCGIALAFWIVFLIAALAFSFGGSSAYIPSSSIFGMTLISQILLHPAALFAVGFVLGFRRFRKDRRDRFFEHLYFGALDSREIVNAKLLALLLPVGALLAGIVITSLAAMIVLTVFESVDPSGGASLGSMRWSSGYRYPVMMSVQLVFGAATSAPALLGGLLGGMRVAILGRRSSYLGEGLLQIAILAFSACCGPFALVNLHGYSRVVNEFWWHVVFLDTEGDWGGWRL